MRQESVDLEVGLLWRREYEWFDVTLNSMSRDEDAKHMELPHSPLRLNPENLARIYDPEAYGRELSNRLFGIELVESFLRTVAAIAERDQVPLHLRLLLDPRAPGPYHAVRWETLQDPRDHQPLALKIEPVGLALRQRPGLAAGAVGAAGGSQRPDDRRGSGTAEPEGLRTQRRRTDRHPRGRGGRPGAGEPR